MFFFFVFHALSDTENLPGSRTPAARRFRLIGAHLRTNHNSVPLYPLLPLWAIVGMCHCKSLPQSTISHPLLNLNGRFKLHYKRPEPHAGSVLSNKWCICVPGGLIRSEVGCVLVWPFLPLSRFSLSLFLSHSLALVESLIGRNGKNERGPDWFGKEMDGWMGRQIRISSSNSLPPLTVYQQKVNDV